MSDRTRKMQRIVEVQTKLHQLSEWKLAGLNRRLAELQAAQEELLGALGTEAAGHGLFVGSMAKRLKDMAGEAVLIEKAQEQQKARVLQEAMRLKRSERMSDSISREQDRLDERRDLQILLEGRAGAGDASLP